MNAVLVSFAFVLSVSSGATPGPDDAGRGISLLDSREKRSATLLEGVTLAASWKPSQTPPLQLTDAIRFNTAVWPLALDQGGGVSSELRQILALILGFIPGFGLGHLVAGDKDGFILFLVIDIALYAAGVVLGAVLRSGLFWGLGGIVWLVVHVIQALDAYASAGGPAIVQGLREKAVEVATSGRTSDSPVTTTRVWALTF
ncbi:MAG: hypothetical protein WBV82_11930 [Myxococcaceae bacterium]